MASKTLTVMFTDMKDFTSRTSSQSREATLTLIRELDDLVLPVLTAHGGHLVKKMGDALLLTFESATEAVIAGKKLQEQLGTVNADRDGIDRCEVRVAINTGEVMIAADGDVFGEAVNLASRVENVAEANEVFLTENTYLLMNRTEVTCVDLGPFALAGIPGKVKLYRVAKDLEELPFDDDLDGSGLLAFSYTPASAGPDPLPTPETIEKLANLPNWKVQTNEATIEFEISNEPEIYRPDPSMPDYKLLTQTQPASFVRRSIAGIFDVVVVFVLTIAITHFFSDGPPKRVFDSGGVLRQQQVEAPGIIYLTVDMIGSTLCSFDPALRKQWRGFTRSLKVYMGSWVVFFTGVFVLIVYATVLTATVSGTVGQCVMQIEVRDEFGHIPNFIHSAFRSAVYAAFLLSGAGIVWNVWQGRNQLLHDELTQTQAVQYRPPG